MRSSFSGSSPLAVLADSRVPAIQVVLSCPWTCPICGKDEATFQALAAHRARSHGILREARTRVLNGRCFVCLRNFHTRERLVEHLHKASPICLMNTLLFHPRLDADVIASADAEQRARGVAARARLENPSYAEQIARQGFGPLEVFLVPK